MNGFLSLAAFGRSRVFKGMLTMGVLALPGACLPAMAQDAPPTAPPSLTPPAGNVLFLAARGVGTQNYICLPAADTSQPPVWTFLGPQATLMQTTFDEARSQVSTHFLSTVPNISPAALPGCMVGDNGSQLDCPTWESSRDTSRVWGTKVGAVTAGTDQSCPSNGAIPCLLLKAVATSPAAGPGGEYPPPQGKTDIVTQHAFDGPDSGRGGPHFGVFSTTTYIQRLNTQGGSAPSTSCKAGDLALVPYSADYFFYRPQQPADH